MPWSKGYTHNAPRAYIQQFFFIYYSPPFVTVIRKKKCAYSTCLSMLAISHWSKLSRNTIMQTKSKWTITTKTNKIIILVKRAINAVSIFTLPIFAEKFIVSDRSRWSILTVGVCVSLHRHQNSYEQNAISKSSRTFCFDNTNAIWYNWWNGRHIVVTTNQFSPRTHQFMA